MSAIWMDGFDHYGTGAASTNNLLAGPYVSVQNVHCAAPSWGTAPTGPYTLAGPFGAPQGARLALPVGGDKFYVSFRLAFDSFSATTPDIICFQDVSALGLIALKSLSNGGLGLYYFDNTDHILIAQTSGPVLVAENFHFLEMEIDTTAHTFKLRVDDAQATEALVMDISSAHIAGTIAQMTMIFGNTGGPFMYIDDFFVRDDAGSVNNSWLGDRRVATLFANADTAQNDWTPSYYKEFGNGILRLAYYIAGNATAQENRANVSAATSTSLDIGSGDFTLEGFIRYDALPSASTYSTIFSRWSTNNNTRSYRLVLGSSAFNNSCLQFDTSTDGTSGTVATKILFPWTPLTNTWYHIALVRSAGELLLFVNGEQFGVPIADPDTYFAGTAPLTIGNETDNTLIVVDGTYFAGRMDETRFTNGYARYTGPFAVPTDPFPRGSGSDPHWADVVLLMGYDSGVTDESGFARTVSANQNAISFLPADGPLIGQYSTVNKATPDDNTFISASYINATNTLTMTTQPSNGNTVTVGTKDGSIPAVYTFKTVVTTAFDILIDSSAQNTLINLYNAINAGAGSGTKYGTGTTSNFDVQAVQLPVGQIGVVALIAGTVGNAIASTESGSATSWLTTTLTGGEDIPDPSQFKLQRPPNNTTVISALQMNFRALKTDAGTATVQATLIGAEGGEADGTAKNLTTSGRYYYDMLEEDPDTSGPITPTTIVNGKFQINRTA